MAQQTPPGWYDDGSGTQRYWNGTGWTEHTHHQPAPPPVADPFAQPTFPTQGQHGRPTRRKGLGTGAKVGLGVGGGIVALALFGSLLPDDNTTLTTTPAADDSTTSSAPAAKPSSSTSSSAAAKPATSSPAATPKPSTSAKPKPPPKTVYRKVTAREWKKIAKNPDAHVGETIVVYGSVTQFDSITGADTFRADISGTRQEYAFDYDTNSILSALTATTLADLVEDDEFRAKVTIMGTQEYETTLGGKLTVPVLLVDSITVL